MRYRAAALLMVALSCEAESVEVRLDRLLQLGRPASVVLRGPNPTRSLLFTAPPDRHIVAARLTLRLRTPAGLVASSFAALVNGTPVLSSRLDNAGEIALSGDIPLEAIQDYNWLELRAELHNSVARCESPNDPALWVAVSGESSLMLDIGT